MEQIVFGGNRGEPEQVNTTYNTVYGGGTFWGTSEGRFRQVASAHGIFKSLFVRVTKNNGAASDGPGAGKSWAVRIRVNGGPSALLVTLSNAEDEGNNVVNEIDIQPGDLFTLECNPDGTPAAGQYFYWSLIFEGDNRRESLIPGNVSINKSGTRYTLIGANGSGVTAPEEDAGSVMPTAGSIKDLYVYQDFDAGTDPHGYRYTVRLNETTDGESSIVTITADNISGNDLAHDMAVVATDVVNLMIEPLNVPDVDGWIGFGMTFVADIDGEAPVLGGTRNDLHNADTKFMNITGHSNEGWFANRYLNRRLGQACVIKKLYLWLTGSPGAGNHYHFAIDVADGRTHLLEVDIEDAAVSGNSGALTDNVLDNEWLLIECDPVSVPDPADAYWGFVTYIEPPAILAGGGAKSPILEIMAVIGDDD